MSKSIRVQHVSKKSSFDELASSSHHRKPRNKLPERARTISVIHATVRSSDQTQRSTNIKSTTTKNDLFSFSSNLSTHREHEYQQNLHATNSVRHPLNTATNLTNVSKISRQQNSILYPQVNSWNNDTHQNDIHKQQPEMNRKKSFVRTSPSKSDKNTCSQTDKSTKINERPTILDETKKRKKPKEPRCSYRKLCTLLALLISFLLVAAIVGTIAGILIKPKTSTTTISATTLTTTTIIPTICSCLCTDKTWTFSSDLLARWSFDGTFDDTMKIYNTTPIQSPTFAASGYVNYALLFTAASVQSLSAPYIPLAYTSFTIEAWIKPTSFPNSIDHGILGLCPLTSAHFCLHLLIRKIASNQYLYFGFYGDDCQGNTSLAAGQWIHVAFVFDQSSLTQSIYLNGLLDNKCVISAPFMATMGTVTIGAIPGIIPTNNVNFFQGYIDHVTITKRAKSSCEVYEDATLVACFLFNAADPYIDAGPNSLLSNTSSTSVVSSGHSLEAISFNGSLTSYFQASSFTGLGSINKAFSIILWIRPRSSAAATIVHISQSATGMGWCFPFLGFAPNGSLVAQLFNVGSAAVWGPSIPLSPVWSHIVETWSQTNGLRLYVDGILVASNTLFTSYSASGVADFVTLANSLGGYTYCGGLAGALHPTGPFNGDIDDLRVYSRALTTGEVNTIYNSQ